MSLLPCPLCSNRRSSFFYGGKHRPYYRCPVCNLTFVPPSYFPSLDVEKAEYDLHENSPADPAYRRFLGRLFRPVEEHLRPGSLGLDFGCGPGPTLSVMFEEAGHRVALYDPFYAPDRRVFEQQYDFVTASEVVEHLHSPAKELERIWRCLKPGGLLGIMTKLARDRKAFSRWHYRQDRTHVCFFSRRTFQWIAGQWKADLSFTGNDVILLQKADCLHRNQNPI